MSQKSRQNFIGFPPPLLGATPFRLPVIGEGEGWLALSKPAGIGLREYPWDPGIPNLDTALNEQLQAGKPELLRHDAEMFGSVYYLDPVSSGVALFAKSREALAELRNRFGSNGCSFRFLFVTAHRPESSSSLDGAVLETDAPLLPHNTKPKMIPSSAKGKKSRTRFRLLDDSDRGWALWEARCDFLRPHQVRAHAAVLGIPILGDDLYGGATAPKLGELLPGKRGPGVQLPLFEGVAVHLEQVSFGQSDAGEVEVVAECPRHFRILLQRMQLSAGGTGAGASCPRV